jgi:hypothetical protein
MSARSHSMPLRSIFSHSAGVSRMVRCTCCSSGGLGGRPRGRFSCSMAPSVARIYRDANIPCNPDLLNYNKSINNGAHTMNAKEALHQIATGAFVTDAMGNPTFTLEDAVKIARQALGMAERVNWGGMVRLNTPDTDHLYQVEVVSPKRANGRERILVEANNRAQAERIAKREGFETCWSRMDS